MSLSRSASRIRIRSFPLGRWILALILLLAAVAAAFAMYVRAADSDYRNERSKAVSFAREQGELATVERAVFYTWDESLWVVEGTDREGVAWMLWERGDGLVKEKIDDGFSEARILAQFGVQKPHAEVVRIQPGWFANQPVWEIRYRLAPDSPKQSIGFYSFKEGIGIKTYDLPGS